MVRKEPKGHGTNRYIEGPAAGDQAVIVEDVVTTGGSSLLAIERGVEFGLKVGAWWRSSIAWKGAPTPSPPPAIVWKACSRSATSASNRLRNQNWKAVHVDTDNCM